MWWKYIREKLLKKKIKNYSVKQQTKANVYVKLILNLRMEIRSYTMKVYSVKQLEKLFKNHFEKKNILYLLEYLDTFLFIQIHVSVDTFNRYTFIFAQLLNYQFITLKPISIYAAGIGIYIYMFCLVVRRLNILWLVVKVEVLLGCIPN